MFAIIHDFTSLFIIWNKHFLGSNLIKNSVFDVCKTYLKLYDWPRGNFVNIATILAKKISPELIRRFCNLRNPC